MNSAEDLRSLPRNKRGLLALLGSVVVTPRFCVYLGCTMLALWVSYLLGKDMNWDTLDYHFYAGFSALHDRFGRDYFPAGSQTYFYPYIYVPFYLLASSRLPAIVDASILAVVQSGILWLTYEIALAAAPSEKRGTRIRIAVAAVLFALANPILINQFGSSYADVITAEAVLGGWLLLVRAVGAPSAGYVISAGLLLGAATALKITNAAHALSAGVLLLFIPMGWPRRIRYALVFGATLVISFILICLPWSIRLEQHFGNPLFPLFNEIFRSPQFPTARILDYRFIPDSLANALWRPFAIATPLFMVDDELASPDLRYAVLLCAAILLLLRWAWRRRRADRSTGRPDTPDRAASTRALTALGCAFLADWTLWLTASGNGRYFLAMACVAGVLAVALIYRLCATAKLRGYALTILFAAQFLQLYVGALYRNHIPWNGRPWFEVRTPDRLAHRPVLYLSYGVQSNSFIVPFLPRGAGFVNIAGDYPLGAGGANGAAIASLLHRYAPHIMILARDSRAADRRLPVVSGIRPASDALRAFGLQADVSDCATFVVSDEGQQGLMFVHTEVLNRSGASHSLPDREVRASGDGYLVACGVVALPPLATGVSVSEQRANAALDRLEDACPDLFQPARPLTQYFGDAHHDEIWARRYLNTNLTAWVSRGWVQFIDPLRGGPASYVGSEAAFENQHLHIDCGRSNERYFAKALPAPASR